MIILQNNRPQQIFRYDSKNNRTIFETLGDGNSSSLLSNIKKFRILIEETIGSRGTYGERDKMQVSGISFVNKNGVEFRFSSNISGKQSNGRIPLETESPINGLMPYPKPQELPKVCVIDAKFPLYIEYSLESTSLNLLIYNRWRLYTSGDSNKFCGRNMTKFALEVYIGDKWEQVDYGDLSSTTYEYWSNLKKFTNFYEGNIKLKR